MAALRNNSERFRDLDASSSNGGKGNGNPLQYSCLEYPMDRGAWWAAVHGAARRVGHD